LKKEEDPFTWVPVDVSFIKEFWLPDAEILNLKEFKTLGKMAAIKKMNIMILLYVSRILLGSLVSNNIFIHF
jgi:hypothetical protein